MTGFGASLFLSTQQLNAFHKIDNCPILELHKLGLQLLYAKPQI